MQIFAVFDSTRRILLKAHEFMAQFSTVTTSERLPAMKSWELPQPSSVPRARPHLKPDGSGTHCVGFHPDCPVNTGKLPSRHCCFYFSSLADGLYQAGC